MDKIKINSEYIKLNQLLKLANVCSSGSEAKFLITDNKVAVNNNIASEIRKKIYVGDIVNVRKGNTNTLKIIVENE